MVERLVCATLIKCDCLEFILCVVACGYLDVLYVCLLDPAFVQRLKRESDFYVHVDFFTIFCIGYMKLMQVAVDTYVAAQ